MTDYKLVPAEPTPEMIRAGKHTIKGAETTFESILAEVAYKSMLAAAPAVQGEPAAWMHDSPGRVDVIHTAVKKLLVDSHDTAGYLHRPLDKSEHYTIPLYLHPQPAPDVAVPEGYAILPKELTAENGAKSILIGEFYSEIVVPCPDCEGGDGSEDYDCGFCNSSGTVTERVPVSWTTIKEIWRKAAIALAAHRKQGGEV